ncbi:hypothetical protein [Stenotrophomonas maltophilia]|uniref:hypothetical protein n=1 Tax=Stenotrophomonas maltophilia TaxID=40324 RepID=UPI001AAC5BA8|nr:hypothetical protein [Stenotrophomonas maltophilia]MBO2880321.1 hypothetical protein [Stenotrophomonas maltophilia]
MATKRRRGDSWQYTIKRAGLLPQPVYLSFASEAEGDEYVRRLEALLDRGVVPEELASTKAAAKDLRSQVSEYRSAQHISVDDEQLLPVLLSRLPIGITLPQLTFTWATEWVTAMKREQNLAPSTIRHYVGALSRALDWLAAHGALPMNPLRLLPRGYSTYTADDKVAVKRIDGEAKADQERDRRLELGEEERIREILAGAKPPGRQRPLDLPQREALILMFDMALETAMRMREIYTRSLPHMRVTTMGGFSHSGLASVARWPCGEYRASCRDSSSVSLLRAGARILASTICATKRRADCTKGPR